VALLLIACGTGGRVMFPDVSRSMSMHVTTAQAGSVGRSLGDEYSYNQAERVTDLVIEMACACIYVAIYIYDAACRIAI